MSAPRTWTLRIDASPWGEEANVVERGGFTEQTKQQPLVDVIEAGPVLDLLERLYLGPNFPGADYKSQQETHTTVEVLLREHGRLEGSSGV